MTEGVVAWRFCGCVSVSVCVFILGICSRGVTEARLQHSEEQRELSAFHRVLKSMNERQREVMSLLLTEREEEEEEREVDVWREK